MKTKLVAGKPLRLVELSTLESLKLLMTRGGPKRPSVDLVTQAKLLEEASTDAQNVHEEDKAALLGFPSGVPAYDRFKALGCVWKQFRLSKT